MRDRAEAAAVVFKTQSIVLDRQNITLQVNSKENPGPAIDVDDLRLSLVLTSSRTR